MNEKEPLLKNNSTSQSNFFSLDNPFSDELTLHMHSGSVTSVATGLSCHRVKKVRDPLLNLVPRLEHPGGCEV